MATNHSIVFDRLSGLASSRPPQPADVIPTRLGDAYPYSTYRLNQAFNRRFSIRTERLMGNRLFGMEWEIEKSWVLQRRGSAGTIAGNALTIQTSAEAVFLQTTWTAILRNAA